MKRLIYLFLVFGLIGCSGEEKSNDTPEESVYIDADQDGYSEEEGDCNDNDPNLNPGMAEVCDGLDNNCDGVIDEGFVPATYYLDNDNDGYGDATNSIESCEEVDGYVENSSDCNDDDQNVNPDQEELCDGLDNNCDGQIDEGLSLITFYLDNDNDGYGNPNEFVEACSAVEGYVENGEDCNDNNPNINPGANEACDGLDNNCNGQIDEGLSLITFFLDNDNDGYGNPNEFVEACSALEGYVENGDDCNDNDSEINPGATEVCDGIDNNCNQEVDEGCNNPPYVNSASIEPSNPTSNDVLLCIVGQAGDPDGDPITFVYDWFVNNVSIGQFGQNLTPNFFVNGDVVYCVVRAFDGIEYSAPVNSSVVTIVD